MKIAILDDYQSVALKMADWNLIPGQNEIKVFNEPLDSFEKRVAALQPFDIICAMRERTPFNAALLERLPNLKFIASTGARNASIDLEAAKRLGIEIKHTRYDSAPTIELTWALILGLSRKIAIENASLKAGGWQTSVGVDLHGKTLALLGLGNIGSKVAQIAQAFGMNVIAYSQNLTKEKAQAVATLVTKEQLFKNADFLSVHLVLSDRSRGIVGAQELSLMKPTALVINTSRGPLIDEAALIESLKASQIAGAALDVYNNEPLPKDHIFRELKNVLATPHIGFVSQSLYETFYQDSVSNIATWIAANQAQL